jgi:hypothetical protein
MTTNISRLIDLNGEFFWGYFSFFWVLHPCHVTSVDGRLIMSAVREMLWAVLASSGPVMIFAVALQTGINKATSPASGVFLPLLQLPRDRLSGRFWKLQLRK